MNPNFKITESTTVKQIMDYLLSNPLGIFTEVEEEIESDSAFGCLDGIIIENNNGKIEINFHHDGCEHGKFFTINETSNINKIL